MRTGVLDGAAERALAQHRGRGKPEEARGQQNTSTPACRQQLIPEQSTPWHVGSNRFSGPLPKSWGGMQLRQLELDYNQLAGPLPPLACLAATLESLRLCGNKLTGKAGRLSPGRGG